MRSRALDALTPEVVRRATSGDAASLDRILTALSKPVYNLALRMLQHHEDAEDATQEALIRIATKLSTYSGRSKFSTWAWTVASRTILDAREGRARDAAYAAETFGLDLADGLDVTADEADPETRIYLGRVKLGCGRAMLMVLDGDHRLAYTLVDILGLDQTEAAAAVGVTAATFRKRLSRARKRIRTVLRDHCGIVNPANPCRCAGRFRRARDLDRLESRDDVPLDVPALQAWIGTLEELGRDRAYYRADPEATPSERMLPEVKRVLRLAD